MDKTYEFLEHPADLKIKAFGKTKEELFLNILKGMVEAQKIEVENEEEVEREVKIDSSDLGSLMVDFLNEVLYLSQSNKEAYRRAEFKKFSETGLEAELVGQKIKKFGEDIKAVTYHNLEIKKIDDHWEATVVFDI